MTNCSYHGISLVSVFDDFFKKRMFGHIDHRRQTARNKDGVILTDIHIRQFVGLLHRGPSFPDQKGEILGIVSQMERVQIRSVSGKTGKVDLVLRFVEFSIGMCDFR